MSVGYTLFFYCARSRYDRPFLRPKPSMRSECPRKNAGVCRLDPGRVREDVKCLLRTPRLEGPQMGVCCSMGFRPPHVASLLYVWPWGCRGACPCLVGPEAAFTVIPHVPHFGPFCPSGGPFLGGPKGTSIKKKVSKHHEKLVVPHAAANEPYDSPLWYRNRAQ